MKKIYIDMCKNSEELQKLWQLKASDYALKNSSREIFLLSGKENKNDYIWLPVQHQLEKLSRKFGVLNWIKYDNYCAGFWDYFLNLYKNHPTKEMCGLSVIMNLGYQKRWNGKEWKKY